MTGIICLNSLTQVLDFIVASVRTALWRHRAHLYLSDWAEFCTTGTAQLGSGEQRLSDRAKPCSSRCSRYQCSRTCIKRATEQVATDLIENYLKHRVMKAILAAEPWNLLSVQRGWAKRLCSERGQPISLQDYLSKAEAYDGADIEHGKAKA